MRQPSIKIFILLLLFLGISLPTFSALKTGISYNIPIDYENLSENELELQAEKYYFNSTLVKEGIVKRGAKVRLLRDSVVIYTGALSQLKRFKDDVKEVRESYECGMSFENYDDLKVGDVIECFEMEEIAVKLNFDV